MAENDAALMRQAASGQAAAFPELMRRHDQAITLPSSDGLGACLRDGQRRVLQNAVLNGQRTIELVRGSGYEHLWIAAATYLPERLPGTTTTPYGTTTVAFAFDFLRPAAASLATLRLPIPAGFARTTIP